MENAYIAWLIVGTLLVLAEFVLPGLISVFLGMGALTVAALAYIGMLNGLPGQFITWFGSSLLYIFTLRLLLIRLYPGDVKKQSVDEDFDAFGDIAPVVESKERGSSGRISHGGTTWLAKDIKNQTLNEGDRVRIIGRENITWLVELIEDEEN